MTEPAVLNPERFQYAVARQDLETMEDEAHSARLTGVLDDLSPDQVRALTGQPERAEESSRTWLWHLGMVNDYIGPGDAGDFRVQFDPSWQHVIRVSVE
ncbi:hypothetical protein OJ997_29790 [Solirubrobacter phytolaccae]|uniref:Uncharacterized protein n=1 Tax=Solirubrobacter phytolaccae TaxID=1404360 RepID=A0A9X3SIU3_9ACTN|nr:hypothetical protein [Solirubrobacter phytolaccae]MDA0184532.1 hypothetical protein [Solirubrobacter phytolaccae]